MYYAYIKLFAFIIFLVPLHAQTEIFVTSQQTCGKTCTGTLSTPFDNLLIALDFVKTETSAYTIILLGNSSTEHYLLQKESSYSFSYYTDITLYNVQIRPLFCDENRDFSDPRLSGKCIERDQKITLVIKPFVPSFNVITKISVQNIIFDWSDSSQSVPTTHACISQRKRCCNTENFKEGIDCSPKYSTAAISNTYSFFQIDNYERKGTTTLAFSLIEVRNFRNKEVSSFVKTYGAVAVDVSFTNTIIDDVVFGYGFMIHIGVTSGALWSSIRFSNVTFKKYNYWNQDLDTVNNYWNEGYLLYITSQYRGEVNILGSYFEDFNTASNYRCPMYNYAHNKFTEYGYSRSDIWQRYHWRQEPAQGSLVLIEYIDGNLLVQDSEFKNIIGTHGSVFYVADSSWSTYFTFERNHFDNNFAMYSFANILIVVKSITFIKDCPAIYIYDSNFTNSAGCPGSHGNVGYICYLDYEPPYTRPSLSGNYDYVQGLGSSFPYTYVEVTGSRFENNLLGVSNSLAVVGSMYSIIERNLFKDNGGTTAEIARYSLERSNYFLNMKPDQDFESIDSLIHFGQSTAVYFDRAFKIHFSDNIFENNFGPWEGSYLLGTAITVRTCYPFLGDLIKFENDIFRDHLGIPPYLAEKISNQGLKENAYTPPLITFGWDQDGRWLFDYVSWDKPFMTFIGVQFINNFASYDIKKACTYNSIELETKCSWLQSHQRYQSGLLKFVSGGDIIEDETKEDTYLFDALFLSKQIHEVSFVDVKIINNTLMTAGCLFSSHWMRKYLLENLLIENNKVNPLGNYLFESEMLSEPLLDQAFKNTGGLFCQSQKASFLRLVNNYFIATNLNVFNNIGTIFNIYPDEPDSLQIQNSLFINNTCPYGSIITAYQQSSLLSVNNIFSQNMNGLGIYLVASSGASQQNNIFHTYLKNDGKHAALAYVTQESKLQELFSKAYWNNANPKFNFFLDETTPQGGLYFVESAELDFIFSELKENFPYAGCIISLRSKISGEMSNITNHRISGVNIFGNFLQATTVTLKNIIMANNSLSYNESISMSPTFIRLAASTFIANNLQIFQTPSVNNGNLLTATNMIFNLENVSVYDFNSAYYGSLLSIDSSDFVMKGFESNNINSLLKATKCHINLQSITIKNFQPSASTRYMMNLFDSDLNLQDLKYFGGSDSGDHISLFRGTNNNIKMADSYFLDAAIGLNNIFELSDTLSFLISRSIFQYTDSNSQNLIFYLDSTQQAIVQESVFILVNLILDANIVFNTICFLSNTIVTSSGVQNFKSATGNLTYFIENNILRQETENQIQVFPESQIYILNSVGMTTFQSNVFLSLYGAEGIIKAHASNSPYTVNSTGDLFIDNTGYNGGAICLKDVLPSSTDMTTSSGISIRDSIFVFNKAIDFKEMKGKGGAIYQTTSTQSKQITNLKKTLFIRNIADNIGGAIYFDYMPPSIDQESQFVENFANKINHIASYPVKLGYYKGKPQPRDAYLPNQRYLQQSNSSNDSIREWDNIQSGLYELGTYTFEILDMYDQIVYDDNTSRLEIIPKGISKENWGFFSTKPFLVADNGVYVFSNFRLSYKVGDSIDVIFRSTAIQPQKKIPLDLPLTTNENMTIKVNFRRCKVGEYISISGDTSACVKCQSGFWQTSPHPDIPFCDQCNEESTYCLGADRVGPKKGYWRLNQTADIVLECPEPTACLGNEIDLQSQDSISLDPKGDCAYGYKGNLCSNCIPGWAKTGDGSCTNCQTDVWFYVKLFLTLLFQTVVVIQGIRGTMVLAYDFGKNPEKSLNGAILIRILTNYLQFISMVAGIPVTWPEIVKRFSSPVSKASSISDNVFTIDCMFPAEDNLPTRIAFIKLILGSVGGFGCVLLGGLFWIVCFLVQKKPIWRNNEYKNKFLTTSIVICFMFQTSAIRNSFGFFQCTNLYREDSPVYFFNKDFDVLCWEGEHLSWALGLGVPSLVIWAFVLPFLAFYVIMKNKDKLDSKEISHKYSFLYGGYVRNRYYWEFIIMARKFIFIALLLTSGLNSPQFEVYVSIPLIIIFYAIHHHYQPYVDPKINYLEKVSLVSSSIINFCGLYFELVRQTKGLDLFFIVVGLSANVFFFLSFIRLYFAHQTQKLQENIIVQRILKHFKCIKLQKKKVKEIEYKVYCKEIKYAQSETDRKLGSQNHLLSSNKSFKNSKEQGDTLIPSSWDNHNQN